MSKYLDGIIGNMKYYSGYDKLDILSMSDRLDQCKTCPKIIKENGKMFCKECGCNLLKKTSIKSQQCPLNKWD